MQQSINFIIINNIIIVCIPGMSSSLLSLVGYDSSFLSIVTLHVRVKAMKRDTVNIAII